MFELGGGGVASDVGIAVIPAGEDDEVVVAPADVAVDIGAVVAVDVVVAVVASVEVREVVVAVVRTTDVVGETRAGSEI
jgi:hypothetical protein